MPQKTKPTTDLGADWTPPEAHGDDNGQMIVVFDDGDTIDVTPEQWARFQSLLKSGETLVDEFDDEIVISLKAQQFLYELIDDYLI